MDLLPTKFYMPPVRPNLVPRRRLLRRLDDGLRHGRFLTLVSAPAGYGKTTLIAAWLQGEGEAAPAPPGQIAWLSLDDDDDEPLRFFTYLAAALQKTGVAWEAAAPFLRGTAPLPAAGALAAALLNDLSRAEDGRSRIVVLDDYHKIRAPFIHDALQFWLDHAPPHLHLILITREDPPLTLSRWRVRNQMSEIRAGDLRFTPEEAAAFLNETMELNLTAEDVAALEMRTEGWAAGLQLAAIALQSPSPGREQSDAGDFIAAFSGGHHYVIDYLVEEVLRQQDETIRDFLQKTAVLQRLSPSLCNAVAGREDSRTILNRLEQDNLFLIPLDAKRQWYRYHHLLADSLRAGLDASLQAGLHQRAARWHAAHNLPAAAMRHALAGGDLELAADVLEQVIQKASAWSRGDVARLTGWLDALPPPLLRARPALSLHASRALYLAGQLEESEKLLQNATEALRRRPANAADSDALLGLAAVYEAATNAMRGEKLSQAIAATRRLLADPAAVGVHTAARAADTLGLACELSGDAAAAERAYLQASELAQTAAVRYLAVNARCEAAMMQIEQGRLAQAGQTCREALAAAGGEEIPPTGLAWAILGEVARQRNELAAAEEHLTVGVDLSQKGGISDDLRYSFLFLARLKQAQGDAAAALAAWQQADLIMQAYRVPRLASLSRAWRARLDLAAGNLAAAGHWAKEYEEQRATRPAAYRRDVEELTLARFFLAGERPEAALAAVRPVLAAAQAAGRRRTVIEALIVQALALAAAARLPDAATALIDALGAAAPEGFLRLFLDEGEALASLLPRARSTAPDFVDRLQAAFAGETPQQEADSPQTAVVPPPPHLIEPLTDREQDVLRLLAAGHTNREIAQKLIITVGTAKWHVHNIYQKLDVSNRAEAVARAHEWDLIDR